MTKELSYPNIRASISAASMDLETFFTSAWYVMDKVARTFSITRHYYKFLLAAQLLRVYDWRIRNDY